MGGAFFPATEDREGKIKGSGLMSEAYSERSRSAFCDNPD